MKTNWTKSLILFVCINFFFSSQSLANQPENITGLAATSSSIQLSWVPPNTIHELKNAIQIASGGEHSCALLITKMIYCWGLNQSGQLGDGTQVSRTSPVRVVNLENVSSITAGNQHTCALLEDETVKCWGLNDKNQLGNGTTSSSLVPTTVSNLSGIKKISSGGDSSCALTYPRVWCWGANDFAQLGQHNTLRTSVPKLADLSWVSDISLGENHGCAIVTDSQSTLDRTVSCWGWERYGALGRGFTPAAGYDTFRYPTESVVGIVNASKIYSGWQYSCVLDSPLRVTPKVKCWGANFSGNLGDGSIIQRDSPVDVSGVLGTDLQTSDFGMELSINNTCLVLKDNVLKCWGANHRGSLGTGNTTRYRVPTTVLTPSGVKQVSAGSSHTCAVLVDASVTCWGADYIGQLGDGGALIPDNDPASFVTIPLVKPSYSYRIEWSEDQQNWATATSNAPEYTISGLHSNTSYFIRVSASNGFGFNEPSAISRFTTKSLPASPNLPELGGGQSAPNIYISPQAADDIASRAIAAKKTYSAVSLAKQVGVSLVSSKAKVNFAVAKSSQKVCRKSGSKLKTLMPGNCKVTFSVQEPKPKKGKNPKAKKTVKTFIVK
jgi:alpha-tubulin suppressor-like RCC1 family protein